MSAGGPPEGSSRGTAAWDDAITALALMAIDPSGCGGLIVKARAGVVSDQFFALATRVACAHGPVVRLPPGISDDRLIGGLDLGNTLALGRPVLEPGMLSRADGGVVVVPGAERLSAATAARIASALDRAEVTVARDGLEQTLPSRIALVLQDESCDPDEAPPAALADRLAFHVDLDGVTFRDTAVAAVDVAGLSKAVAAARRLIGGIAIEPECTEAVVASADALGIASQRAPYLALRAARAAAALNGRERIEDDDLVTSSRLVLAPRATRVPIEESSAEAAQPPQDEAESEDAHRDPPPPSNERDVEERIFKTDTPPLDVLIAAAKAALPAGLLERMPQPVRQARTASAGHAGGLVKSRNRGARLPSRPGFPGSGARLDVIATLRAAAPFQAMRRGARDAFASAMRPVELRREDFRLARYKQRSETLTIFAVDASGSAALERLAEAKGAVELLLADCYVRRDWVALVAFRGKGSAVVLPPTRSLTRAKRCLGEMVGGGGTPIAAGLKTAFDLARAAERQGRSTTVVVLTDGRPNIALSGQPGRVDAEADALGIARLYAASGERSLVIDSGARPTPFGRTLAATMGGTYLPLPFADASAVSQAIRKAS